MADLAQDLRRLIPAELFRPGVAGLAGLIASFVVINGGLRLSAAGRRFLAEARSQGRLLANPRLGSPWQVKLIFLLAGVAAVLAAAAAYLLVEAPVSLRLPAPIRLAGCGAC